MRMRYTHEYQPNKQRRIVNCASDALSSMIFLLRREWRRNVNQILFARSEQLDVRFLGGDTHTQVVMVQIMVRKKMHAKMHVCALACHLFVISASDNLYSCFHAYVHGVARIYIYIPAHPYTSVRCLLKYFNCKSLKFIVLICKLDVTS